MSLPHNTLVVTAVLQLIHHVLDVFLFQISGQRKYFLKLCPFDNQPVGTFPAFYQLLPLLQNVFVVIAASSSCLLFSMLAFSSSNDMDSYFGFFALLIFLYSFFFL